MNKLIPITLLSLTLSACGSGGGGNNDAVSKAVVVEDTIPEQQEPVGMSDELFMEYILGSAVEAVEASFFLIKTGYNNRVEHREPFLVNQGIEDSVEAVDLYVGFYTKFLNDYTPNISNRIVEWYEDGIAGGENSVQFQQQQLNFDGEHYLKQIKLVLDAGGDDLLDHYNTHVVTRFNNVDEQYAALQAADIPGQITEMLDTIWVDVNMRIEAL